MVHDELITADLDEVGIQIRTRNNEGKVEIHVVDTDGTWHSYIEWSTASADEFNFGGTCNPLQNLSPTKQVSIFNKILPGFKSHQTMKDQFVQ